MSQISTLQRREIVTALRNGTVPMRGIEQLAVGLSHFETAIDLELEHAELGHGSFKAVRGEYGAGKTFFSRWVQHRALRAGFATSEVQISETETPLNRMETVYRRAVENLRTAEWHDGAFRALVERWFYALEDEVMSRPGMDSADADTLAEAVGELLELRLGDIAARQPQFATALRGCYQARVANDAATFDGLLAWLMGQPYVGASIKRRAGLKGDLDHYAATGFLRGLLAVLRQSGRSGLLLVLDEVETIQRMRSDVREKSLNGLRQLIDEIHNDQYPGLYLLITGTPSFFDGPHGARRLPPLAQRLHVDFGDDPRFDSSRAPQVRLMAFDESRLVEVGRKVRDLYPTEVPERLNERVNDDVIAGLARAVTGELGGKVGIAPRIFLKKLVTDVLDRVEEHAEFDPVKHYRLKVHAHELTESEKSTVGHELTADDIELDLGLGDKS